MGHAPEAQRALSLALPATPLKASRGPLSSICVFCSSSEAVPPSWRAAAARLGREMAHVGVRLVYGGGGVGLMGEVARAVRGAGGQVLGIIPRFLIAEELASPGGDTIVVSSMHERKLRMFREADAFVILPGAIGTLEETVELLSWRRLGLHTTPIVFFSPDDFWEPLFALFRDFVQNDLLPSDFDQCWSATPNIADVLPTLRSMPCSALTTTPVIRSFV